MTLFQRAMFSAKKHLILRSNQAMYRQLLHDERLEPEKIRLLQAERAIAHARFAMESSPFYRERYTEAGFKLSDLHDPAVFFQLPIVEKADVRERFAEFRTREATAANSRVSTTGGSTGEPLKILRDLRTPTRTIEWRLLKWWGINPYENIAIVYRQVRTPRAKRVHDAQWWPSRRIQLDAFQMDETRIDAFFNQWERVRPALLLGYVGAVASLLPGSNVWVAK